LFADLSRVVVEGSRGLGRRLERRDEGSKTEGSRGLGRRLERQDEGF